MRSAIAQLAISNIPGVAFKNPAIYNLGYNRRDVDG